MFDLNPLLAIPQAIRQAPLLGVTAAAASLALYLQIRPTRSDVQHLPEEQTITRARTRVEAGKGQRSADAKAPEDELPYSMDAFPGGRQFNTIYGTIQVFEWGPENGEKVLMMHGLSTPCIALGDMAKEFVKKGCRVMIFDFFGRGYSDTPNDLKHDARLYTTQILLVLSSSPLSWTGSSAFHIVGFSLGGSVAVAFAAYHATMLRSVTLICPGGLIRTSHISSRSQFLYSSGIIPDWFRLRILHSSLEPRNGAPRSADVPEQVKDAEVDFDDVPIAADRHGVKIGDVVRWQLKNNDGFVSSYLSSLRSSLVFRRHDGIWRAGMDILRTGIESIDSFDAKSYECRIEFLGVRFDVESIVGLFDSMRIEQAPSHSIFDYVESNVAHFVRYTNRTPHGYSTFESHEWSCSIECIEQTVVVDEKSSRRVRQNKTRRVNE